MQAITLSQAAIESLEDAYLSFPEEDDPLESESSWATIDESEPGQEISNLDNADLVGDPFGRTGGNDSSSFFSDYRAFLYVPPPTPPEVLDQGETSKNITEQNIIYILDISSLPNELFAEIFEIVRANAPPVDSNLTDLPPQVILSHVCQQWRRVAIGMAAPWTEIFVMRHYPVDRVVAYLERSQRMPLDITFDYRRPSYQMLWNYEAITRRSFQSFAVLEALVPHAPRWRNFTIMSHDFVVDSSTIMARLNDIPALRLESLRLLFKHYDLWSAKPSGITLCPLESAFSSRFRNLRCLELCTLHFGNMPTYDEFRALLEAAPLLQHLTVLGCVINTMESLRTIEMPSLVTLSIGGFHNIEDYIPTVLSSLSMPELQSLEFIDVNFPAWMSFRKYIEPSPQETSVLPKLRSLAVMEVIYPPIETSTALEAAGHTSYHWLVAGLPNLETLTLNALDPTPFFRPLLAAQGPDNILWPNLHTITLHAFTHDTYDTLCALLTARLAAGRPIAKLRLEPCLRKYVAPGKDKEWLQLADRVLIEKFDNVLNQETLECVGPAWPPRYLSKFRL